MRGWTYRTPKTSWTSWGVVSPDLLVQARIDVLNATADLESANESKVELVTPTFQAMAKAQSDVTAARLALQEAEDDLDALLNPTDADLVAAEADVSEARLDLEAARDALEALTNVDPLDLAKAQAAVADAELDVEAAQAAVDEATTPATTDDIADYQSDIDSASDTLVGAQFDLDTAERNAEEKIGDAKDDLETAQADYNAVFLKWLGMNVAPLYDQSHEEILSAHDVDLESLFGESRIREMMSQSEDGVMEDDPGDPVERGGDIHLGGVLSGATFSLTAGTCNRARPVRVSRMNSPMPTKLWWNYPQHWKRLKPMRPKR